MTKIKICGLMSFDDINYVNEALPDYIGFVFAESKRRVTVEQAKQLKARLARRIQAVGVFVNEDINKIKMLVDEKIIDAVQLHGDEDDAYVKNVKRFNVPVIKAIRVKTTVAAFIEHEHAMLNSDALCQAGCEVNAQTPADFILFDTYKSGQYGGTGERFDWSLCKQCKQPFFLAGGLNAGNIAEAITTTAPYCVDISGGVETGGKKDRNKILEIVNLVKRFNY